MNRAEIIAFENHSDLVKGVFGSGIPMLATLFSYLAEIEAGLRIISLVIGIAVGIATFLSIRRRK